MAEWVFPDFRHDLTFTGCVKMQTVHQISDPLAKPKNADRRALQDAALKCASRSCPNLAPWLCKSYAIFRSVLAHIWLGFSTMEERVDLGPSVQFQNGRYFPNVRTRARAEGIRKMLAMRPSADNLGNL